MISYNNILKSICSILLYLALCPVIASAQSIYGTWYTTSLFMLEGNTKEQKVIFTKDSIVLSTTTEKSDYLHTPDSADEYAYKIVNIRDTVETTTIKIVGTMQDAKLSNRGYMIVAAPEEVSTKGQATYSLIRYTLIDKDNCTMAVGGNTFFKTKKQAEKAYQSTKYTDLFALISSDRAGYLKTLKDPDLITKEEATVVLTELRDYLSKMADILNSNTDNDQNEEAIYMKLMNGITEQVGISLEKMGYNPIVTLKSLEPLMDKYKDDPKVKRIMDEIEETMKGK